MQNCALKEAPLKLDDLSTFSIPISISNLVVDDALCYLSSIVSLMLLSIYKRLPNVRSLLQSSMTLYLADQSIRHPKGILKDVLVVQNLVFPSDFIFMDMPEYTRASIILGRLRLATTKAVIDVKKEKLTLEVGKEKMVFRLQKSMENAST